MFLHDGHSLYVAYIAIDIGWKSPRYQLKVRYIDHISECEQNDCTVNPELNVSVNNSVFAAHYYGIDLC